MARSRLGRGRAALGCASGLAGMAASPLLPWFVVAHTHCFFGCSAPEVEAFRFLPWAYVVAVLIGVTALATALARHAALRWSAGIVGSVLGLVLLVGALFQATYRLFGTSQIIELQAGFWVALAGFGVAVVALVCAAAASQPAIAPEGQSS